VRATEIEALLNDLDGRGSDREWKAVKQLRGLRELPEHLLRHYRRSRRFGARAACVYHCTPFAASNQSALTLGILALEDKSKIVRYRAALLLAIAQKTEAIPALEAMRQRRQSNESADDAAAAITAIRTKNPNRFVDRENSGMLKLNVEHADP